MKTYLLQSFLLLLGITAAHGQVNLSGMPNESSDSLQKSKIRHFSPGKVERTKCGVSHRGSGVILLTPEDDIDSNGLHHVTHILNILR